MHNPAERNVGLRQYPTVGQYMTPCPYTITRDRSLASAHKTMATHGVRHLPVVETGRIVGLLSERDILFVETLPSVNPTDVRVEDAMTGEVFTASPDTPVAEVIETMIARKLGSAVVTEGQQIVGVFTTIDALRALHALLEL